MPGNYEETPYISYGNPWAAANQPRQIIRNMFVPGQNARTSDNYPTGLAIKDPLTIKGLVEKVYSEFGKSITIGDLNSLRDGNVLLKTDLLTPTIEIEDGIFTTCTPQNGVDNMFFTKKMAFYLLEMHNYVQIDDNVKEVLYKQRKGKITHGGRQYTFDELIDAF